MFSTIDKSSKNTQQQTSWEQRLLKNTARSKHVNDRERRRRKRTEEAAFRIEMEGCYRKAG